MFKSVVFWFGSKCKFCVHEVILHEEAACGVLEPINRDQWGYKS